MSDIQVELSQLRSEVSTLGKRQSESKGRLDVVIGGGLAILGASIGIIIYLIIMNGDIARIDQTTKTIESKFLEIKEDIKALGDAIHRLEPIVGRLESVTPRLESAADTSQQLGGRIGSLEHQLEALRASLETSAELPKEIDTRLGEIERLLRELKSPGDGKD